MKFFSGLFREKSSNEEKNVFTDEEYVKKSKEFLEVALEIKNSTDDWKLEKKAAIGDTVESKYVPGIGKYFRITGELNFPPKKLLTELFLNIESTPKWNSIILSSKRIKMTGDYTDIIYQVTAPCAGGLVSTRDFVSARFWTNREGCYMVGGGSVEHADVPVNHQYIRGESGPVCQVATPIPGVADRCMFQWILNTRLNGWLPQSLVDMATAEIMFNYMKNIRKYGDKLREGGLMND